RADQRKADAGISGRPLDDRSSGPQRPPRHRIADDVERGTVLDRLPGIEELALAENLATGLFGRPPEPDQWCAPHGIRPVPGHMHRLFLPVACLRTSSPLPALHQGSLRPAAVTPIPDGASPR